MATGLSSFDQHPKIYLHRIPDIPTKAIKQEIKDFKLDMFAGTRNLKDLKNLQK